MRPLCDTRRIANLARILLKSLLSQLKKKPRTRGDDREALLPQALADETAGRLAEAESTYRRLIEREPEPDLLQLLGSNLARQGKSGEALQFLEHAAALAPQSVEARYNLATALAAASRRDDAVRHYEQVLALRPDFGEAMNNLANLLKEIGRADEAERWYRRALELTPDSWEAANNLARLLHVEGRIPEALAFYQRVCRLKPDFVDAHTNYIYWLNFDAAHRPEAIFEAHLQWAKAHAEPLRRQGTPHRNEAVPDRRLRIGYVSPNFKDHAAAFFFESTLACHDTTRFEIHCYSDVKAPDEYTARMRDLSLHWHETAALSDEDFATRIAQDRIDILVDLTGHTEGNRLLAFARKPAPVQVTWNGYANTTGMSAMDYRITDVIADPPGVTDALHTEKLIRMPHAYMVFTAPHDSPPVSELPAAANGCVTFGSFNAITKITPQVVSLWARILKALPSARLLIATLPSDAARRRLHAIFEQSGVASDRIETCFRIPKNDFLALHHRADIALDPFPFNGTTTTCHSLWMGLPVVTLAGTTHVSRVGASMLTNVGLPELVASHEDRYVQIAVGLARDVARLHALRSTLRERMRASHLMDAPSFTRELETQLRTIWRAWCDERRELSAPR